MRSKALIQEHLLDTLNIYFWALENFLEASEVEESIEKWENLKSNFEISRWIFEKSLKKHVFPNFQADVYVLWTWELVRLKALIQEHLLDTLNIYFWTLEKILEASKGEESIQKMSKSQVRFRNFQMNF